MGGIADNSDRSCEEQDLAALGAGVDSSPIERRCLPVL